MILTFKQQRFEGKIINGTKIHTIREDRYNRWQPGKLIHFWSGNPRNTKQHPYCFGIGKVSKVQYILIDFKSPHIIIDGISNPVNLKQFAINDGFNSWEEMKRFFATDQFIGKLITWEQFERK